MNTNNNSNGMQFGRNRYDAKAAWGVATQEPVWQQELGKLSMLRPQFPGNNKLYLVMINGKWVSEPKKKATCTNTLTPQSV